MTRPRRVTHAGSVDAVAFVIDPALIGHGEAATRVISLWEAGVTVHATTAGYVVRLSRPRRVRATSAPGLPLVAMHVAGGHALAASPLDDDELAELAPAAGDVVLVRAGEASRLPLTHAAAVDPSAWIDLGCTTFDEVESLGEPPAPPVLAVAPITATRALFREVVGPLSPEAHDVVAALQRASGVGDTRGPTALPGEAFRPGASKALRDFALGAAALAALAGVKLAASVMRAVFGRGASTTASAAPTNAVAADPPFVMPSWLTHALTAVGAVLSGVLSVVVAPIVWLFSAISKPSRAPGSDRRLTAAPREPSGPGWIDRALARMSTALARALVAAKLAHLVGRRQAEYLGDLMDLLQRGDLDEALRRAIPLGGSGGPGGPAPGVALGVPTPRTDLAIRFGTVWPSSSMGLGGELFDELRRLYRGAFTRLEHEGRIDEAAFVLAELLHADDEAVTFLERHGRLRMAAELAEGRGLAPGLVVRQWFVAGDRARAIKLARKHGAFADAVVRLERANQRAEAAALRLLWADSLAEAGDYAGAVDVCWALEEARPLATRWLDLTVAQGGIVGARAFARKLGIAAASSDTIDELAAQTTALLSTDDPRGPELRRVFARALVDGPQTKLTRLFAKPTTRALFADAERDDDGTLRALVERTLKLADDRALTIDRAAWPATPPPAVRGRWEKRVSRGDIGTLPIFDAAALPDSRALLALGELGVRLVARTGTTVATFDQPAEDLVVSDHGDRAIAVARRGEVSRLSRIDLARRRAGVWGEASLRRFARDFDGAQWVVLSAPAPGSLFAGDLIVIDALDEGLTALHRFGNLAADAYRIERTRERCDLLFAEPDGRAITSLKFDLPSWTLRERVPHETDADLAKLDLRDALSTTRRHRATPEQTDDAFHVTLHDRDSWEELGRVTFEGATRAGYRLTDDALVVWDNNGRALAVDPTTGLVLWEQRS